MPAYRLHGFAESGNSYKVALTLTLAGADWTAKPVDFFNGGVRTPDFLALNPMGEAPVLETLGPDGRAERVETQSGAILVSLARRLGRFGPETPEQEIEILRWLLWDNHKLTGYAATERFMKRFMPAEKRDAGAVAFLEGRRRNAMKVLERRLAGAPFLAGGETPTIADLSACGYLFWMDEIGENRADWPATAAWLDRIAALPGWAPAEALMPRAWPEPWTTAWPRAAGR